MGHYETLRTENLGMDSDLYLVLKAKLMHKKSTEEVTIIGIPPITIISNGNNATVGLKGNTVQSGTPTPDNPIIPQGTGERTGNLFDKDNTTVHNAYFAYNGDWLASEDSRSVLIAVTPNTRYTLSISDEIPIFRIYQTSVSSPTYGNQFQEIIRGTNMKTYTFTTASAAKYIGFQGSASIVDQWIESLMLNTGSTALPYEPYGYKIPISSAGQATPIYLGEVETIRKIKKLVLDGTEAWYDVAAGIHRIALPGYLRKNINVPFCTHYVGISPVSEAGSIGGLRIAFLISASGNNYMYIRDSTYSTATAFQSYLAAQYAAGTPVTVWYVLATEETGIVNEPLMKIGDYADEISDITIPTIKGTNVVDVDTEVKPSEISITYTKGKGININNISDMENLTIADLEKMTIAELEG